MNYMCFIYIILNCMAVQHTHTRVEISCKIIYELLRFEAWLPLALQMRKQYKILCATFIFITFIMRVLWGLKQFCELVLALISSSYLYVFFLYIIFFFWHHTFWTRPWFREITLVLSYILYWKWHGSCIASRSHVSPMQTK